MKLSKVFYLSSIVGVFSFGTIVAIVGSIYTEPFGPVPIFVGIICFIYSFAIWNLLIYRIWQSIQDGNVRTTPALAVGFLFVPYYNFYWIFQAVWGFTKDCNRYIERSQIAVRKLPEGLSLVFCIVALFWFLVLPIIIDLIIGAFLINRICDTVNQLQQPSRAVPKGRSKLIGNNKSLHNYLARRWIRRAPELLLFNVFMGIGFLAVIATPFIPVTATSGWAAFTLAVIRATSNVLAIIFLSFVYLDLLGWWGILVGAIMVTLVVVSNNDPANLVMYIPVWLIYTISLIYVNTLYARYKRLAQKRIAAITEETSPGIDEILEKGILQQIILRQNEHAVAILKPTLSMEGGDALLWYLTGVALANMKMHSEALAAFNKAMEASPNTNIMRQIKRSQRTVQRRMLKQ